MKCFVCGISPDGLVDIDPMIGTVLVDLSFGQNVIDGKVSENDLDGYALFLADVAGNRVQKVDVISIDYSLGTPLCCQDNAYSVRVGLTLPARMSQFRFEIVPVTKTIGVLPAGILTDIIVDAGSFGMVSSNAQGANWSLWAAMMAALASLAARCWTSALTPAMS